jgi:hypothetical protein
MKTKTKKKKKKKKKKKVTGRDLRSIEFRKLHRFLSIFVSPVEECVLHWTKARLLSLDELMHH